MSSRIFENAMAKWTFCIQQVFGGPKPIKYTVLFLILVFYTSFSIILVYWRVYFRYFGIPLPPPPPADPVQSSRNCLKYSEKCIPSIQGNFLPSLAFILFTCKKNGFQLETGFHPGFKFSTSHFVDGRSRVLQVFSLNRLIANKRASISRAILEIGAKAVIYI